jgi:hypothetical protein
VRPSAVPRDATVTPDMLMADSVGVEVANKLPESRRPSAALPQHSPLSIERQLQRSHGLRCLMGTQCRTQWKETDVWIHAIRHY